MPNCIFCKIINKEIPNYTVYEDEHVLAFLDIQPRSKGHTIVIPKVHAENSSKLSDEQVQNLFVGVKRAQAKVEATLHPDGYNVGWNQGEAGGQVVPHVHVHIMPRWHGDGGNNMHGIVNRPGDEPVEEIYKLF